MSLGQHPKFHDTADTGVEVCQFPSHFLDPDFHPLELHTALQNRSVGLCINAIIAGDDATKAWDTFSHISAAYRNYQLLFVGQTGNPKCAAIAMIPEPMETDPSLRVDLRSHDEKVSAAKSSWAAWEKRMNALPFPQMKWALGGALRGFLGDGTLWRDAKPTHTGKTVVAALQAMGDK